MSNIAKIPTLSDLIQDSEMSLKENALMVICNQSPPKEWISYHPFVNIDIVVDGKKVKAPLPYLPIERVEYLLTRIFGKWWVEIRDSKVIANSVQITVRLYVRNPLTGETEWNDGIGANPIQTDSGKGAMDWNYAKNNGVQLASPAAETYAIKDAAEKFGKLFGKDLTRKDIIGYEGLLKDQTPSEILFAEIQDLFSLHVETLTKDLVLDIERVIEKKEVRSYRKIHKILSEL